MPMILQKENVSVPAAVYLSTRDSTQRLPIKRKGMFHVYIVECSDGTYYTGYTNNLEKRLKRHNDGLASKYTRSRLPVKLIWCKEYKYYKKAFLEEKRIKELTRKQKEKLILKINNAKKPKQKSR